LRSSGSDSTTMVLSGLWLRWRLLWRLFLHLHEDNWDTVVRLPTCGLEARLLCDSLLRPPSSWSEQTAYLVHGECCNRELGGEFLLLLLLLLLSSQRCWGEGEETTECWFISSSGSLHGGESGIRGDGPSKVSMTPPIVTGNMFMSPLTDGEVKLGPQIAIAYALELTTGGILRGATVTALLPEGWSTANR
jgi:hypothetical protein